MDRFFLTKTPNNSKNNKNPRTMSRLSFVVLSGILAMKITFRTVTTTIMLYSYEYRPPKSM